MQRHRPDVEQAGGGGRPSAVAPSATKTGGGGVAAAANKGAGANATAKSWRHLVPKSLGGFKPTSRNVMVVVLFILGLRAIVMVNTLPSQVDEVDLTPEVGAVQVDIGLTPR